LKYHANKTASHEDEESRQNQLGEFRDSTVVMYYEKPSTGKMVPRVVFADY